MSTHWDLWCPTCEEKGPQLRRGAGGVGLLGQDDKWAEFLIDHEYHGPLVLVHEGDTKRPVEVLRET